MSQMKNPKTEERVLSKDEARLKLKEAKENLDLELISQKEYDILKEQLKSFILVDDNGISGEERIKSEPKSEISKDSKLFSFNCRNCGNSMNFTSDEIYDKPTNFKCSQCSYDNWIINPRSNVIFKEIQYKEFEEAKIPIIEKSDSKDGTSTNSNTSSTKEKKETSKWVYIGITILILWIIGSLLPPSTSSSSSSSYYCDECGDGISGQPYQCVFYACTKARTVAPGLDTFCSCACGVEHRRKEGFNYTCN